MLEMFFSFRYYSQLFRIKPTMVQEVYGLLKGFTQQGKGVVGREGKFFCSHIDDTQFGVYLELTTCIEQLKILLDSYKNQHFGYTLILSSQESIVDNNALLSKLIHSYPYQGSIWCNPEIKEHLSYFFEIEENEYEGKFFFLKERKKQIEKNIISLLPAEEESFQKFFQKPEKCTIFINQNSIFLSYLVSTFIQKQKENSAHCIRVPFGITSGGIGRLYLSLEQYLQEEEKKKLSYLMPQLYRSFVSKALLERSTELFYQVFQRLTETIEIKQEELYLFLENIHLASPQIFPFLVSLIEKLQHHPRVHIIGTSTTKHNLLFLQPLNPQGITIQKNIWIEKDRTILSSSDIVMYWYLVYVLKDFFPPSLCQDIIRKTTMLSEQTIENTLSHLVQEGLLFAKEVPYAPEELLMPLILKDLEKEQAKLQTSLITILKNHISSGQILASGTLLRKLLHFQIPIPQDLLIQSIIQDLYDEIEDELSFLKQEGHIDALLPEKDRYALEYIITTSTHLFSGNEHSIKSALSFPLPDQYPSSWYESFAYTNRALLELAFYKKEEALLHIKHALLEGQRRLPDFLLSRIYRVFALVELQHEHIQEALEYISFSIETAKNSSLVPERFRTFFYAAVISFLYGNYSRALYYLTQSKMLAEEAYLSEWLKTCIFLEGRIYFETGKYRQAYHTFSQIEESEGAELWMYRTKTYLHNQTSTGQIQKNEKGFFQIEAAFFKGLYDEIQEATEILEGTFQKESFLYTEQPDREQSFAHAEVLLAPRHHLMAKMTAGYSVLASYKTHQLDIKTAISRMEEILASCASEFDGPFEMINLSLYIELLKDSSPNLLDFDTALSKAFKRLQTRASRIDDYALREAYLYGSYWNSRLMEAAKERKLC
ncbi:MAG TPA: hypothetical protein PLK03_07380 [Termitinemataceae bacterium]|nr:hypothetical protein [Termitinemataceae bacterium]